MTITYTAGIPNAPNNPSVDQPNMKANNDANLAIWGIDHVSFNAGTSGIHNQVTFAANNVPAVPTSPPVLFTNNVASIPQLFFYSGSAAQGMNQYIASGNGSTFCLGGIILKWGTYMTGGDGNSINFAVAFPNGCFNVQVTIQSGSSPNSQIYVKMGTVTVSSFQTAKTGSSNYPIFYTAIGY
jgi:hypothetical protein